MAKGESVDLAVPPFGAERCHTAYLFRKTLADFRHVIMYLGNCAGGIKGPRAV